VSEIIAGIDLGSSKVAVVVAMVGQDGTFEVLGKGIEEWATGSKNLFDNVDELSKAIESAVKKAEVMSNMQIKSVYANIPGTHVEINEGATQVSLNTENEAVNMIVKSVELANLELNGLIVDVFAAGEVLFSVEDKGKTVLVIDVGGSISYISIVKDNRVLFQSSLGIGGDSITKDLSIGLDIPYFEAEKIKRECGIFITKLFKIKQLVTVLDSEGGKKHIEVCEIADIIEARANELIRLTYEVLKNSKIEINQIKDVVLCGSGISYIDEIFEYAGKVFDLPVRVPLYKGMGEIKPEYLNSYGITKYIYTNVKGGSIKRKINDYSTVNDSRKGVFRKLKDFFKI
jgi:cell division protein FtsA